ncbi:MAG: DUF1853 family protein [Candidatus Acinetobacter avistercoris]|uniref:DUF1853 family protein n=1 Tax=Acinetobacter sp. KS-LM10 TaxID=3120518 RepID=UPI001F9B5EDF|nr:DUF1853 family protein [Candidatus Acinetobacter avistercoris]
MTVFYEPWLQFKHPIVRQLAFCIASPNIIRAIPEELKLIHEFKLHDDHFWQSQFAHYQTRLLQLDQDPTTLLQFLGQLKSTRLGLRFEHLLWFWLLDDTYHAYTLLGHSIQIIEGKNTLGELDFIVLNQKTQQIEHWEVALKFYLSEIDDALAHWYGLNRTDTLSRKLNHFTQKQFQFHSAQQHIIEQRFAVLKGQLYLTKNHYLKTPNKNLNDPQQLPHWINPKRRIGHWGYDCLNNYYRVERQEWICPNLEQSSANARWWCSGLYRNFDTNHDYMFRQANLLYHCVEFM